MRGLAYWYLARMYAPPYNPNGVTGPLFHLEKKYSTSSEELKIQHLEALQGLRCYEEDWTRQKVCCLKITPPGK